MLTIKAEVQKDRKRNASSGYFPLISKPQGVKWLPAEVEMVKSLRERSQL